MGDHGSERTGGRPGREAEHAVYVISVAAELAGVHPQTLRTYERKGLLQPKRTAGNSRRYSQADIDRLRTIQELTEAGVNLMGVKLVIDLRAEVEALRAQLAHRRAIAMPGRRGGEIVPRRSWPRPPWEDERP
jgi:MerR family transcriptional regulator/heat shock protein HspR